MKLIVKKGNLTHLLKAVISSFAPSAERNDIQIHFNKDASDVNCYFDAEKLEKVFSNLLSLALLLKYRSSSSLRNSCIASTPYSFFITIKEEYSAIDSDIWLEPLVAEGVI